MCRALPAAPLHLVQQWIAAPSKHERIQRHEILHHRYAHLERREVPRKKQHAFAASDRGFEMLAAFDANEIGHSAHVAEPRDRNLREECADVLEVLHAQRFDFGGRQVWETGLEIAPHDGAPTALKPTRNSAEVLVKLDREAPWQDGCETEPSHEYPCSPVSRAPKAAQRNAFAIADSGVV